MSDPQWFVMVEGAKVTWKDVCLKLSSGAWSLDQALALTGFTKEALMLRLSMTRAMGGAAGRAAASAIARVTSGVATEALATGGLAAIAAKLGVSTGVLVGGLVTVLVLGGIGIYFATRPKTPAAASAPATNDEPCPPAEPWHRTLCPWAAPEATPRDCPPGACWDAGPGRPIACVPRDDIANAKRTYTFGLECLDGFTPRFDRCTKALVACE